MASTVDSAAERPPDGPEAPTVPGRPGDDAVSLVRRLSDVVETLYGVGETASVVLAGAMEATPSTAATLLLPDGETWRVAGGTGLRQLELRSELPADAWLVREVATSHHGAIIEDSDVARQMLQGAPLASRRHLVAVPISEVDGILVLARDDDPGFNEAELLRLADLGQEAAPLLAAALDTRRLARALSSFRDEGPSKATP